MFPTRTLVPASTSISSCPDLRKTGAQADGAITGTSRGIRRSDGTSRWSWWACEMRTASRSSTVSAGGDGAIRMMYAMRSRRTGSVSTRVPSSSTSDGGMADVRDSVAELTCGASQVLRGRCGHASRMSRSPYRRIRSRNAVSSPHIGPTCRRGALGTPSASRSSVRDDDPELAVGVAQVELDGGDRHEQRLGDVAVARPGGRQPGDPALAGGERAGAGGQPAARPSAGGAQLGERLVLQVGGAAAMGEVDREAQRIAGLDRPAGAPQGGAGRRMGPGALERCPLGFDGEHGAVLRARRCTAVGAPLYYADARAPNQGPPVRPAGGRDRRARRDRRAARGPGASRSCASCSPTRDRPVDRGELIAVVWPERPPRDPAGRPAADPLAAPARARAGDDRGARPAPARAARARLAGRRAGGAGAGGQLAGRARPTRLAGTRERRLELLAPGFLPHHDEEWARAAPPAGGGARARGARVGRARGARGRASWAPPSGRRASWSRARATARAATGC